jgi:hypothetical protein
LLRPAKEMAASAAVSLEENRIAALRALAAHR